MVSEQSFFNYEIDCINNSKKNIILVGYDHNFFNNQNILNSLYKSKIKKKIDVFLNNEQNLDDKIKEFNITINEKILSREGIRIYDFGGPIVYFDLDKPSTFEEEKNVPFRWTIEPSSKGFWFFPSEYNIYKDSKEAEYARKIEHIANESLSLIIPKYAIKFNKKVKFVEKEFPDVELIEDKDFAKLVHNRFERMKRKAIPIN